MGNQQGKGRGKKTKLQSTKDIPKGRLVHDPDEDINKYYEITERTLGQGTFSKVKEGIDRESKQKVAIKIVYKEHVSAKPDMLRNEVEILLKIDHPNVIKLIDLFDTEQRLYLVMELVTGGELFDKIVEREQYSEADAKEVMRQLFDAIEYIHSQDVVHRDLKPENLLLEDESTSTRVKLSDFGLSRIFDDSSMNTACGTPGYVAPEILRAQGYNSSVDMWSAGVIMYILLCGYPPFYNENDAKLFESIMSAAYHFHSPFWDNISKEAKDLIRALLVVDPAKRLTATQAKEAEWFKIAGNTQTKPLPSQLREKLEQHNKDRKSYIELKQEKKGN